MIIDRVANVRDGSEAVPSRRRLATSGSWQGPHGSYWRLSDAGPQPSPNPLARASIRNPSHDRTLRLLPEADLQIGANQARFLPLASSLEGSRRGGYSRCAVSGQERLHAGALARASLPIGDPSTANPSELRPPAKSAAPECAETAPARADRSENTRCRFRLRDH